MNEIVNNFFLARDVFMPEIHWRQPEFIYSACGTFKKNKERIQNLKKQKIQYICIYYIHIYIYIYIYIYQDELDKACFQNDMAYVDFEDLTRKTTCDKILRDKTFNIAFK